MVIIIFGAAIRPDGRPSEALRRRVAAAARFGAGRPGMVYVPTGGQGRHGAPECEVMATMLVAAGVAPGQIRQEPTGVDTLSSVVACVAMVRGLPGPVYAASSRFHLPRCLMLLWIGGVAARPVPIEGSTERRWRQRWYWRLREVPALPYDAVLMLWWSLKN
jgi:vancomycin permeability regulator SanA